MKNFEIERKFLVDLNSIPYDLSRMEKREIEQGYILYNPEVRVRSVSNSEYYMTLKSNTDNSLLRREVEFKISEKAYNKLMNRDDINKINKTRYITFLGDKKLEIDVFKGKLSGLACLEIEFDSEDEAKNFSVPSWVKKEVTSDFRYRNSELSKSTSCNFN